MSDPTPRSEATKQKWANPEIRQRIIDGQRRYWQNPDGTPNLEVRKQRGKIAKNALAPPEVRQRISEGTKEGLKPARVREKISESSKRAWDGNTERRETASKLATDILCNPEIVARARAAHATPESKKAMSDGNTQSWAKDTGEGRQQTSDRFTQLWADRKQKLAEAERILADAKGAKEQITQLEQLALTETTSKKLAEPAKYMWVSPDEVAEAFGINRATFFRNVGRYPRLKKGPKKWYLPDLCTLF